MVKKVFVYNHHGVDPDSLLHTTKSLQQTLLNFKGTFKIQSINASQVMKGEWREEAALFVMPGGRDLFYLWELGAKGAEEIRSFVHEGGRYLGICAGAYFACSAIEFERGGEYEVKGPRPLAFFPGIAKGPALGLGKYAIDSHRGVEAALIDWGGTKGHIYYNGGPTFSEEIYPNIEVLARYVQQDTPALIQCCYGKGSALLSGVHFEYSTHRFSPKNPYLQRVYPLLQKDEPYREIFFQNLIEASLSPQKNRDKGSKSCYN